MRLHTPVQRLAPDPRVGVRSSLNLLNRRSTPLAKSSEYPYLSPLGNNVPYRHRGRVDDSCDNYRVLNLLEKQIDDALYAHQADKKERRTAYFASPTLTQTAMKATRVVSPNRGQQSGYETLLRKSQRQKSKIKMLKQSMQTMQEEYNAKCAELESRITRYDEQATALEGCRARIQAAIRDQGKDSALANQAAELTYALKNKEIELSEQLLANKRLRDELCVLKDRDLADAEQNRVDLQDCQYDIG